MKKLPLKLILKHTPGPWELSEAPVAKTDTSSNENPVFYTTIIDKNSLSGRIICKTLGKDKHELLANAKLIAAAPEMLEVLIMARRRILDAGIPEEFSDVFNLLTKIMKQATT